MLGLHMAPGATQLNCLLHRLFQGLMGSGEQARSARAGDKREAHDWDDTGNKWKEGRNFYLKCVWIPSCFRTAINPRSNDKGDGEGNGNVKRNEPNK